MKVWDPSSQQDSRYNIFQPIECNQVAEPLRAMVMGAPLEDARHLTQRYDRLRQEAEAQVGL